MVSLRLRAVLEINLKGTCFICRKQWRLNIFFLHIAYRMMLFCQDEHKVVYNNVTEQSYVATC